MGSWTTILNGRIRYTDSTVSSENLFASAFEWNSGFPLSLRNLAARTCKMRAADVSGMTQRPTAPNRAAMMSVIQDVHLHPRCDSVMKPPAMGPATGPANPPAAKTQMAYALGMGSHRSARAPPTTESGAAAKKPPRKRPTQMVAMFCATATGIWKRAKRA